MKRIAIFGICFLIGLKIFAQSNTAPVQNGILSKLKAFNTARLSEKVYLQFDKPYYAAGDTIYFKAYVTAGERHQLSAISGVLHVDLVNMQNKIDQSIKLQLVNGVGWGDFALPDSLPKGNYRVRAWTRWMRNDPGSFFEKDIPVGSIVDNKIPESGTAKAKPVNAKADLQFFPEGGELVTGINNKIAFKAIGINGLGINVKGTITDNTGKPVTMFASARLGMGYFELTPEEGKSYKAELTFADGTKDEVALPQAKDKGIVLSVNSDSLQKATITIQANQGYFDENKGKNYTLLIYSGGIANTVSLKLDSASTTIDLIKRKLFTGITRITLFSQNNEPLAERLIFVQNYDQLNLNIKTNEDSYRTRDKIALNLTAKTRADSAAMGHFSVSIVDENKVKADENNETTILSGLLLTSDLKGYIEQPNYYFNNINDQKLKELDLVILTHGYRRFEWKQVLDSATNKPAYQPEKGLEINGTAMNVLGKPIAKGTVSLISRNGGPLLSQTTDDKGNFHFTNLVFIDTTRFVLNATNAKGNNNTKLTYTAEETPPPVDISTVAKGQDTTGVMNSYLKNAEKQQEQLNALGLGKGRMLKEVKIRAIKEDNHYRSSSLLGPGHADQVMHANEIARIGGQLSTSLDGRLVGVKLVGPPGGKVAYLEGAVALGKNSAVPMLLIVDGVEMARGEAIDMVGSQSVETVEVLRFANTSIYGSEGGNGVIIITTKQGKGLAAKDIASKGVLPIMVQGFYKAREFYAPKYEHPEDNTSRKDLRSTIYWQPELKTDKEGNAAFDFYNADAPGSYRVTIEGIDMQGNLGRKVFTYVVN